MTSYKGDPNRNKKTDVFIEAFVYKVKQFMVNCKMSSVLWSIRVDSNIRP